MAEGGRRRAAAGIVCLGLAVAQAARADDGAAGADTATSAAAASSAGLGTASTATGSAGPGSTGPIVAAPSLLPATGVGATGPDVRVGNLGNQLAALSGRPLEPATRAWTITPSLALTQEYTTGSQTGGTVGSQFITTIQPGLLGSGDTTRLHGEFSYAPQIQFYAPDGHQNQVAQNFSGRLLATVVPGTLFLDLRGSAAVQAVAAGQAPNQTTALSRSNTSQTYSFSATPYAVHRFGAWGTAELGGTLARTAQNALQPATPSSVLAAQVAALADASNQNVTTTSGHLAFETGEAFARYSGTALAQATSFDGTGVLRGAYRNGVTLDSGYAITRTITALATIGWEDIHYAGSDPVKINDAVWNLGVRLEPNADSTITLRYGHQDGLDSVTLDAAYQPTARTRIFARYSTGLATQAEQLQNALATSDLDAEGNPVDHTTGAPLLPVGSFFGTQNSLYETTLASLTATLLLDRDSLAASVNRQTQRLVSASSAVGLAQGSTSGVFGSLSWSHEVRENLQSTVYVQYGTSRNDGPPASDQELVVASAALSYALSRTLSGQLQYSYTQTFGGNQGSNLLLGQARGGSGSQSLILASLIKSF